jgi:proline racemase
MKEKQLYLEDNLDDLRTFLVKGADEDKALVAALITEPTIDEADVGLIWMDKEGYFNMCGSGSFAVGTALINVGIIKVTEPVTEMVCDTPIGLLKLRAKIVDGEVESVTTTTSPAFFYSSFILDIPDMGKIPVDISYGLNFFEPMIDAKVLGIELNLANALRFEKIGLAVRDKVNADIELRHPEDEAINKVKQVQFYISKPANKQVDCRCLAIVGPGGIDLTPSGTSTCAHMAYLHAQGKLRVRDEFVMESVIGTTISGKIVDVIKYGSYQAIIPEITGSAHISRFLNLAG